MVEVVIDVPASRVSDSAPPETEEVGHPSPINSGPRRSSRQSAQGKSYALRKKRNRHSRLSHEETPSEGDNSGADRVYLIPEALPALPSTVPSPQPESQGSPLKYITGPPTTLHTRSTDLQQSRSRSPSVVQGTPEPLSPGPHQDDPLEYFGYLRADIRPATDVLVSGDIEAVHRRSREGSEQIAEPLNVTCTSNPHLGLPPVQVPVSLSCQNAVERTEVDLDDVHTDRPASTSSLACSDGPLEPTLSLSSSPPQDADDEDILLLGATFEDEEEVIWPETKPNLAQPTSPPASSEWPDTSCEMSFKSIKGEKQEMATFTAPFRCSRIIDLTTDDLCDDDEHDELDEW